jgi:hypothetical protein
MKYETAGELRDWQGEKDCREAVENLVRRGFAATYCASAAEAAEAALSLADGAASAGFGGSKSVDELGVPERLRERGVATLIHGGLPPEEKARVMAAQKTCDVFYLSANAVTVGGEIVNIDGVGNRVSASIHGPRRVVFVVGRNKLVRGDLAAAIARARTKAAPPNSHRLGRKTPCAQTGVCADCTSPERICNVLVVLERRPSATDTHVLVVNADLGL